MTGWRSQQSFACNGSFVGWKSPAPFFRTSLLSSSLCTSRDVAAAASKFNCRCERRLQGYPLVILKQGLACLKQVGLSAVSSKEPRELLACGLAACLPAGLQDQPVLVHLRDSIEFGNTPRELSYLLQFTQRPVFTAAADHWRAEDQNRHVVLLGSADWTRSARDAGSRP